MNAQLLMVDGDRMVVVAYLVAAAGAVSGGSTLFDRRTGARLPRRRSAQRLWGLIALVLLLAAIERQLQLLDLAVGATRQAAWDRGLYANRRPYQAGFIAAVAILGLAAPFAIRAATGRAGRPVAVALTAAAALVAFLPIRAASLHQVDAVLNPRVAGTSIGTLVELAGIAIVGLAALAERRVLRRRLRQGASLATEPASDVLGHRPSGR